MRRQRTLPHICYLVNSTSTMTWLSSLTTTISAGETFKPSCWATSHWITTLTQMDHRLLVIQKSIASDQMIWNHVTRASLLAVDPTGTCHGHDKGHAHLAGVCYRPDRSGRWLASTAYKCGVVASFALSFVALFWNGLWRKEVCIEMTVSLEHVSLLSVRSVRRGQDLATGVVGTCDSARFLPLAYRLIPLSCKNWEIDEAPATSRWVKGNSCCLI
jgi:hypothetical protein